MLYLRIALAALTLAGSVAVALTATTRPAHAQGAEIEAAKSAGVVGEQIDGYLGFVNDGPVDASLIRRVNEINARRRAVYDELAGDANVTTAQVARLTGEKQIERTPGGQFFLNADGIWEQKSP
ncbi:MAG: YdbL family protein [Hyphomonadaceae bacterium]|nr:YdbL family protein [Hyphomonadaceae bacterium]